MVITEEDIKKAADKLIEADIRAMRRPYRYIFVCCHGISEQDAIEFFKNTCVLVVARDGSCYFRGEKWEGEEK